MKKIEAIIRYSKFDEVKEALAEIGVKFFSLKDVKGYGLQKGKKTMYRGSLYGPDFIARLQLDIVTTAEKLPKIIETIKNAAATGDVGDGKIFVYDIEQAYRIRNSDIDQAAL